MSTSRVVRVELLSHDGCPLAAHTRVLLGECLAEAGLTSPVTERVGAHPSPTVLVDGRDVMGDPGLPPGTVACRLDVPTRDRVLGALLTGAAAGQTAMMDRQAVHAEMDRARTRFHQILDEASDADLARASNGTRWTNQQLLFHMLLGYLIIRALGNLARLFGRLPDPASRAWARLLDAATTPFDIANYLGSYAGGTVLGRRAQAALFDRVIAALHRRLDAETDAELARGMHYPTRWDPFFRDYMTLADVYRFPTQHFDFHHAQLTLPGERLEPGD